jgi:hypothetical protein
LSNARLEAFEFGRGWVLDKLTIEMVEPRYMPLIGYAEAWSPSTPGEVTAPIVVAAGKTAQDISTMPIKGAAVMQAALVTNFIATDRAQPALQPDAPPPTPSPAAPARAGGAPTGTGRGGRQGGGGQTGAGSVTQAIQAAGAAVLLRPSRGLHGTVFVQAGRAWRRWAFPSKCASTCRRGSSTRIATPTTCSPNCRDRIRHCAARW